MIEKVILIFVVIIIIALLIGAKVIHDWIEGGIEVDMDKKIKK